MSNYARNKIRSRTVNNSPSLTDQSAAKDCDRNVIVKKFMVHGQLPTGRTPPIYMDFANLPDDLPGLLKQQQRVTRLRASLPSELKDLTLDALLALTPDQLREKLKKPEPPAKTQGETA